MYCPRCSQQQIADLRFCPGCGLQLDFVIDLVANNGVPLPQAGKQVPFLHRKGISFGAKLVFLSLFILPISFLCAITFDTPGPFAVPFIIFMVGLAQVLYTLLFKEPERRELSGVRAAGLNQPKPLVSFPVGQGPPVTLEARRVHTAEMIRPRSVTEHTTKLLDDNSQ
jgi:hypothetical protein